VDSQDFNKDSDVTVICGLDVAYECDKAVEEGNKRVILVVPEPYREHAEAAVSVPVAVTPHGLVEIISSYKNPTPGKIAFGHGEHCGFSEEHLENINSTIEKALEKIAANRSTSHTFGDLWQGNAKENLGMIQAFQKDLLDEGTQWHVDKKPIVIVGAGPSLDSTIDQLVEIRDEVCVMAVSHAMSALETVGIIPDYCMVIDAQDVRWHFECLNASMLRGTTALLGATVHPSLFHLPFKDIIPFNGNTEVIDWIDEYLDEPLYPLIGGGNVLTALVKLAIDWGMDKICLIGADCTFTAGKVYADITIDGGSRIALNEDRDHFQYTKGSSTLNKLWKDDLHPLITLPAINGGYLPTSQQFYTYHDYLQYISKKHPGSLYQCSESGAYINLATHCSLTKAVQQ
tara:strand:+ start:236 stop:1438 length:1203 start_codon:yes stop_codon:yes gene_type:complete